MSTQPVTQGWVPNDQAFGARLALIRQRMGWGNVREAALACGVPVESWRGWERDGRLPRDLLSVCRSISQRTGADLGWLAGLTDDRGPGQRSDQGLRGGLPRLDSNQEPAGYVDHPARIGRRYYPSAA